MRRNWLGAMWMTAGLVLLAADGCGSSESGSSSGGASTGGASTGGASTGGASTGGASTGGASTGGASTGGASTGGTGGTMSSGGSAGGPDLGPFLCGNCQCDGNTNYCSVYISGAGTGGVGGGDAGDSDAACAQPGSNCYALPATCNGVPSCDCLAGGTLCKCAYVDGGYQVTCNGGSGGV
jgi:hypothetical protein